MADLIQVSYRDFEQSYFSDRNQVIEQNWDWYAGNHVRFIQKLEAETNEEFNKRRKAYANFCRIVVDTITAFIYNRQPKREFIGDGDGKLSEAFGEIADYYQPLMLRGAVQAAVTGYSPFQVVPFSKTTRRPFPTGHNVSPEDVLIAPSIMPSEYFYPARLNPSLVPNDLSEVRIFYSVSSEGGVPIPPDRPLGVDIKHLEIITEIQWQIWENNERKTNLELDGGRNPYDFIPYQMFTWNDIEGDEVGQGALEDIKPLNAELNNEMSDFAQIMKFSAFPVRYGPKLTTRNIGPQTYIEIPNLPGGGSLNQPGQLVPTLSEEPIKYMNLLIAAIAITGKVPRFLMGDAETGLGQLESEVAVKLLFTGFIQYVKRLMGNFAASEQELIRKIFRMKQYYKQVTLPKDFDVKVTFPDDIMPSDRMRELDIMEKKRGLGLDTQKNQLWTLNPDLTEDEIDELLAEIQEEQGGGQGQTDQVMLKKAQALMEDAALPGGMTPQELQAFRALQGQGTMAGTTAQ
jgi:hypothetical protein